ncbi:MAG: hypothetical protein ACRD2H_12990 [Terriglobales bacterium]
MKKLLAVLTLVASFSLLATAAEVTLRGKVGDAMCGAKNTSVACVTKCLNGGGTAVLVSRNKVYKVSNPDELKAYAGQSVVVKGSLEGDTLTVSSVKARHARRAKTSS